MQIYRLVLLSLMAASAFGVTRPPTPWTHCVNEIMSVYGGLRIPPAHRSTTDSLRDRLLWTAPFIKDPSPASLEAPIFLPARPPIFPHRVLAETLGFEPNPTKVAQYYMQVRSQIQLLPNTNRGLREIHRRMLNMSLLPEVLRPKGGILGNLRMTSAQDHLAFQQFRIDCGIPPVPLARLGDALLFAPGRSREVLTVIGTLSGSSEEVTDEGIIEFILSKSKRRNELQIENLRTYQPEGITPFVFVADVWLRE
jgi:hypothetical protein